jgi:hypothetical protein
MQTAFVLYDAFTALDVFGRRRAQVARTVCERQFTKQAGNDGSVAAMSTMTYLTAPGSRPGSLHPAARRGAGVVDGLPALANDW